MRSFSVLLVEALLLLSIAAASTIPVTRNPNHELVVRAGPEPVEGEKPPPEVAGRPGSAVRFGKDGGAQFGISRKKLAALLKKVPGWRNTEIPIVRTRDAATLQRYADSKTSYVLSAPNEHGVEQVDVIILDAESAIARQLDDGIPDPDSPKGMLPLTPKIAALSTPKVYFRNSKQGKTGARFAALWRKMGPKDPANPAQVGPLAAVKIGSLRSIWAKSPPATAVHNLRLYSAAGQEAEAKGLSSFGTSYVPLSPDVPKDVIIMAPPPGVGSVLVRPFKALYTNVQRYNQARIARNGQPTIESVRETEGGQPVVARRSLQEQSERIMKRSNTLTTISGIEEGAAVGVTNTTEDLSASFQEYYTAFLAVQANSTALIYPFLEEMIKDTNSSLVLAAAWSIWNDLTAQPQYSAGPFLNGMHCLDQIEDEFLQQNNLTTNSPEYLDLLALDGVLIQMYQTAWNKSSAAMQQSGLSDQLLQLAGLMSTTNPAILPANFQNTNGLTYDNSFFIPSNSTS